jgi:hypothetical protein
VHRATNIYITVTHVTLMEHSVRWRRCTSLAAFSPAISALYSYALGAGNNKTIVSQTSRYLPEYVLTSAMRPSGPQFVLARRSRKKRIY